MVKTIILKEGKNDTFIYEKEKKFFDFDQRFFFIRNMIFFIIYIRNTIFL